MSKPKYVEPKLIAVQLEPCHANLDGSAWYAYYEGELMVQNPINGDDGIAAEIEEYVSKTGVPHGIECDNWEEVPNALSEHTRLHRYYVGAAT